MSNDPPAPSPLTTGPATYSDPPGVNHKPDNSAAPPQPPAPNSWRPGRDLYAGGGAVGQPQFGPLASGTVTRGNLLLADGVGHLLLAHGGQLIL